MDRLLLHLLDSFFLIFHSVFTLFNVFGWIWRKTRKAHLITMCLTAFSWFVLGIWYGWGYCFCTDWHWHVRESLGNPIESYSYIHFLILELSGINFNPAAVDYTTFIVFIICLILTVHLNLRDRNRA